MEVQRVNSDSETIKIPESSPTTIEERLDNIDRSLNRIVTVLESINIPLFLRKNKARDISPEFSRRERESI